jgi:hypothetical protein
MYVKLLAEGNLFGGGNDADYYHAYALGITDVLVNLWPTILRFLNEIGLYNRDILSLVLFVISVTFMPYLYYKIVKGQGDTIAPVKSGSFLLILFYPTIVFFTVDVYRDIFMFFTLLLSLLLYKKIIETHWLKGGIYFLVFLSLTFILFLMREYLGVALGLAPFFYYIFFKTKRYIKTWVFLYFILLILAKVSGVIDPILLYRGEGGFVNGGSTLGIGLSNTNSIMFLVYFFYNIFAQLFGFFLISINVVLVFILESVPFILVFIYVFKNIRFLTKFGSFLLVFFVFYTTIWLLGNDNLGTAVRLRVPSYLAIFACMFIVYQEKTKFYFKN